MRSLREKVDRLHGTDMVGRGQQGEVARESGGIAGNEHQAFRLVFQKGLHSAFIHAGPGRVCDEQVGRTEAFEAAFQSGGIAGLKGERTVDA